MLLRTREIVVCCNMRAVCIVLCFQEDTGRLKTGNRLPWRTGVVMLAGRHADKLISIVGTYTRALRVISVSVVSVTWVQCLGADAHVPGRQALEISVEQ